MVRKMWQQKVFHYKAILIRNDKDERGFYHKETGINIINIEVLSHTILSFKVAFCILIFNELADKRVPIPMPFLPSFRSQECRQECFPGGVAALVGLALPRSFQNPNSLPLVMSNNASALLYHAVAFAW